MPASTPLPDFAGCKPRPLSSAQLPIWRAEMLYRNTPRWTQVTVVHLHGAIDAKRLEQAIGAVVARHPALRTQLVLQKRQAWQIFAAPAAVHLHHHEQPTAAPDQPAAIAKFLDDAASHRFPLYGAPLFRADLLVLDPQSFVLVLRLHHIAADGVALALIVQQISGHYRGETSPPEPDLSYEQWLDAQSPQASSSRLKDALAFYQHELAGVTTNCAAFYDQPDEGLLREPPHLHEATCTLDTEACEALRTLARTHGATLFILLFAAYGAVLRSVVNASDVLVATFVSGRANHAGPLVGSCINTLLVRLRLQDATAAGDLITAVKRAWRPVRQHQAVPMSLVSDAAGASMPTAHFAINYLDMNEAPFLLPGIATQVTHAQQGYPLNDLLLYALREQDGRLRLRLIGGSGTASLSEGRIAAMLQDFVQLLQAWVAPCTSGASS